MENSPRKVAEIEALCPHCKSKLQITILRTTTTAGVPAETETTAELEVIKQAKLFEQPEKKPRVKGKNQAIDISTPKS